MGTRPISACGMNWGGGRALANGMDLVGPASHRDISGIGGSRWSQLSNGACKGLEQRYQSRLPLVIMWTIILLSLAFLAPIVIIAFMRRSWQKDKKDMEDEIARNNAMRTERAISIVEQSFATASWQLTPAAVPETRFGVVANKLFSSYSKIASKECLLDIDVTGL